MCIGLHSMYTISLSHFNKTSKFFFLTVSKNTQILDLMKIRPVGEELM